MAIAIRIYAISHPNVLIQEVRRGEKIAPDKPEKERVMLVARPWDFSNQFVMIIVMGTILKVPTPMPFNMPRM